MAKKSKIKEYFSVTLSIIILLLFVVLILYYGGGELAGKAIEYANNEEGELPATITFENGDLTSDLMVGEDIYVVTIDKSDDQIESIEMAAKEDVPPVQDEEPVCGDGNIDEGEECDDGDANDDGGVWGVCREDCTLIGCGDGILDLNTDEECDDGNDNDEDECKNDCTLPVEGPVCGDNVCEANEVCPGDCLADLTPTVTTVWDDGNKIHIRTTVENLGLVASEETKYTVKVYNPNLPTGQATFPNYTLDGIDAESFVDEIYSSISFYSVLKDGFTYKVIFDSLDTLEEIDETNNEIEGEYSP
jgi:hypothetical protein